MTQTDLGNGLGVSFQQVQKYEVGANRMAVSTVIRACTVLGIAVSDLFEGLEGDEENDVGDRPKRRQSIQSAYHAIPDRDDREAVRRIIDRLATA